MSQTRGERGGAAVRRMTDVRRVEHRRRDAADRDHVSAPDELVEIRPRRLDLRARRRAVRRRCAGMRRHDVPEEHVVRDPELAEDAVDDRRARLGRAASRELAFRRERDAADARAAVAGGLADEDDRGIGARLEVRAQALLPERRTRVLVVGPADARVRQAVDEVRATGDRRGPPEPSRSASRSTARHRRDRRRLRRRSRGTSRSAPAPRTRTAPAPDCRCWSGTCAGS